MEFSLVKKVLQNNFVQKMTPSELDIMSQYYLYAAREGRSALFTELRKTSENKDTRRDMTLKALNEAARYGQREFINNLVLTRAKSYLNANNYAIIRSAASGGHKITVSFLLNKIAPVSEHAEILKKAALPEDWISIEPMKPSSFIKEAQYADITKPDKLPEALKGESSYGYDASLYNQMLYLCFEYCKIKNIPSNVEKRAYNAQVLFGTSEYADQYLRKVSDDKNGHKSFDFELPKSGEWDITAWRDKVIEHGHTLIASLKYAPEIEKRLKSNLGKGVADATLSELRRETFACAFNGGDEHPEVARVGLHLNLSQEQFNETVNLLEKASGTDNTPNIYINGKDIGCDGFTMEKVAKDDPLNLWIGGFRNIDNCNKIGKLDGSSTSSAHNIEGANLAILQSRSENISLYVIRNKNGTPVAKMTGWLQDDAFVFNSWQSNGDKYNDIRSLFILEAARQSMAHNSDLGHKKVMLGIGVVGTKYSDDEALTAGFQRASNPVYLDEYDVCEEDAERQLLILEKDKIGEVDDRINALIKERKDFLENNAFPESGM